MVDIIKDVSTLTTINEEDLNKLTDKFIWCICNAVNETNLENNQLTELDIGIGTLFVSNEYDNIKYKFIPSKKLEKYLVKTVEENKNPLRLILEKKLSSKITNTYKDIF